MNSGMYFAILITLSLLLSGCNPFGNKTSINPFVAVGREFGLPLNPSSDHLVFAGLPTPMSNQTALYVSVSNSKMKAYKYKIESSLTADCESPIGYSTVVLIHNSIFENMFFQPDGYYTICAVGMFQNGNLQNLENAASYRWLKDTTDPDPVANVSIEQNHFSLTSSPNLTFTNGSDLLDPYVKHYVKIQNITSGTTDVNTYLLFESGNNLSGLSLTEGNLYRYAIVVMDAASNTSSIVYSNSWVAHHAPTPILSNLPTASTSNATVAIAVSGTGLVEYQYKLGLDSSLNCSASSGYSSNISSATLITDDVSGFTGQTLKLCVLGVAANGNTQIYSLATTYSWTIDITPPSDPSNLDDQTVYYSLAESAPLSFTVANDDVTVSPTYQVKIQNITSGTTDVTSFADFVNGDSVTGLTLNDGEIYRYALRAVDGAGNTSNIIYSDGWTAYHHETLKRASSITFTDLDGSIDEISGIVRISKAVDENSIDEYVLYYGSNSTTKSSPTPIATLTKSGADRVYYIPMNTTLPVSTTHILVYTKDSNGELTTGKAVALQNIPSCSTDNLVQNNGFESNGSFWSVVTGNVLYQWARSGTKALWGNSTDSMETQQTINVSDAATIIDQGKYKVSHIGYISTGSEPDVGRILVEFLDASSAVLRTYNSRYSSVNSYVEMSQESYAPIGTRYIRFRLIAIKEMGGGLEAGFDDISLTATCEPDLNIPQISFTDSDPDSSEIGGDINLTKAPDEYYYDQYIVYYGTSHTTKMAQPALAVFNMTGANQTLNIPSNSSIPAGARYLLLYTSSGGIESADPVQYILINPDTTICNGTQLLTNASFSGWTGWSTSGGPINQGGGVVKGPNAWSSATVSQIVDVSAYAALIDAGKVILNSSAQFSGAALDADAPQLRVFYRDQSNTVLRTYSSYEMDVEGWIEFGESYVIPPGTRNIRFYVDLIQRWFNNDARVRSLSLTAQCIN